MTQDDERRRHKRYPTSISVDCRSGDNFLFAYIRNISEFGIFIQTESPLPVGTELQMRFGTGEQRTLSLEGEVVWVNPMRPVGQNINPGMGVRFHPLTADQREQIVEIVRTVAYLQDDASELLN